MGKEFGVSLKVRKGEYQNLISASNKAFCDDEFYFVKELFLA